MLCCLAVILKWLSLCTQFCDEAAQQPLPWVGYRGATVSPLGWAQPMLCLTPREKDERQESAHHRAQKGWLRAASYLFLELPLPAQCLPPLLLWMLLVPLLLQLAHSPLWHVQLCPHLCQLESKCQTMPGSLRVLKGTAPPGCWTTGIKLFQLKWESTIWISLVFGGKIKWMIQISVKLSGKYYGENCPDKYIKSFYKLPFHSRKK